VKVGELRRDEANVILDRLQDVDEGRLELAAARQRAAADVARLEAEHARQGAAHPQDDPPRT
jgi:hypothetical protein